MNAQYTGCPKKGGSRFEVHFRGLNGLKSKSGGKQIGLKTYFLLLSGQPLNERTDDFNVWKASIPSSK